MGDGPVRHQFARTASTGSTHDRKPRLRLADHNLSRGGGRPHMKRRQFMGLIGGTAIALPTFARAEKNGMPMIGFLSSRGQGDSVRILGAFRDGLSDTGYTEGQ